MLDEGREARNVVGESGAAKQRGAAKIQCGYAETKPR
jgi:hypothetical protein